MIAVTPQDLPSGYEGLRVGFTAAVSHELRTPLARLLSLLDTAKLPGVDVDELIDEARAEIVEMTQLVDDILFLSELEQGREVVALGFTEVAPVRRTSCSTSRASARCAPSSRSRATCLPASSSRCARACCSCSSATCSTTRCATPGGEPRSASRRGWKATRSCSRSPTTAPGVDPADVPRLFERFFRSDRSRTTRGTGLGLAIVKHIVGAADGTAEVTGALGEGTRFRFVLPAPRSVGRLI